MRRSVACAQEFDSDEENDSSAPVKPAPVSRQNTKVISTQESGAAGAPRLLKSKSMPAGSGVAAILAKRDPVRDRPDSAQRFREISATDSEMKVLYRYSNFRRMPLTEEQVRVRAAAAVLLIIDAMLMYRRSNG